MQLKVNDIIEETPTGTFHQLLPSPIEFEVLSTFLPSLGGRQSPSDANKLII
jgi:hypothetical protein